MFPAIFLDRDGVLIENRAEYVRDWSQVSIYPEAIRALSNSKLKNHKIVIVTNQSAVGRGIISLETAEEINDRLVHLIRDQGSRVDGVYLCPHGPDDGCDCRKPRPGLLLRAARELSLDLKRSWMIGDAWSDVQAGQSAGVQGTILLKTGRGADQLSLPRPADIGEFLVCEDLPQALKIILADNRKV
ncbi:MAG: HAD family hydrolase [Anaerolineales bacterium]|jgi:D-glycero-D-manno-heptose 1,7-bisphosphate phosphatase|nr:HAD family hydrolase [Anaerolineales bacterium]